MHEQSTPDSLESFTPHATTSQAASSCAVVVDLAERFALPRNGVRPPAVGWGKRRDRLRGIPQSCGRPQVCARY
jgi:hypothetical protein